MASRRRILEAYIKSITLYETGDRKVPEAQNAVVALLTYPLPGRAEVMATTGLIPDLTDGKTLRFNPPKLFFKEYVQGPSELTITVTDRDDRNRVVSFLRRLGGAFFQSAGEGALPVVPGLFKSAFQEAVASGRLAIGESNEDRVEVVAVGSLVLGDMEEGPGNVIVNLDAPRELQRKNKPPIKPGSSNGQMELVLRVEEP